MIPWAKPHLFGNEKELVLDALNSSWISGGPYVEKFEKNLSDLIKVSHVITTSNGTTALTLALLGLEIGSEDEVIIPGFCFVAVGNTVIQTGAKPVYVDIEEDTWNINPDDIKRAITPKTKAIIPVHNYGNVCDMEKIMKIAKEHDLYVVEDVAEAPFSKYNDKFAGTFGDIGCFSFQATKTITTGEGGAAITNNSKLAQRMKTIKNHGLASRGKYWHEIIGYNFRLTNLQAALGCGQLENLSRILENKKRVYERYKKNLQDTNGITFQTIKPEAEPIIWAVAIRIDPEKFKGNRDFLIDELLKKEIETRPGFYPFSKLPPYDAPSFPISDEVSKNIISLPSYSQLTDEQIDYICQSLKSLLNNN